MKNEMTPEERAAAWREKFPNAKHPECPWCEIPHEPAPQILKDGEHKGDPDPNCCEFLDRRLTSEDFARLRDRFDEMLRFIGYHDYDSQIGKELFQGDWWWLMMMPREWRKGPADDDELGVNNVELLRRLKRLRRELLAVRALAGDISLEFSRSSKRAEEHVLAGRTGLKARRTHELKSIKGESEA